MLSSVLVETISFQSWEGIQVDNVWLVTTEEGLSVQVGLYPLFNFRNAYISVGNGWLLSSISSPSVVKNIVRWESINFGHFESLESSLNWVFAVELKTSIFTVFMSEIHDDF
jgi:hypothetical protein